MRTRKFAFEINWPLVVRQLVRIRRVFWFACDDCKSVGTGEGSILDKKAATAPIADLGYTTMIFFLTAAAARVSTALSLLYS